MQTINISVAEYYGNTKYYGVMPRWLFAALERAFVSGSPSAAVDQVSFETMLCRYHAQSC